MSWTVTADVDVLDALTEIYLQAEDMNAVSKASNDIDAKLRLAPLAHGIIAGTDRILYEPPLVVVFEIKPADRIVNIKQYYFLG